MSNKNLHKAKSVKNDEFYTRYEDIEKELKYYDLKGKSVYCNTDDYRKSNFVKYFIDNFNSLGITKITATCFDNGDGVYMYQYDGENATHRELGGNGDFRSEECVELLKQSDLVVTNPPFSLFREFISQMMEYNKKFLIMGNGNAVTAKDVFPLIKENKIWLGYLPMGSETYFYVPKDYQEYLVNEKKEGSAWKRINGVVMGRVTQVVWFTNIEHSKRTYPLDLYKKYDAEKYPKYDNYDAIHCERVEDIPCDYSGVIGVPISFLNKYCPTQFEIVDARGIGLTDRQKNKSTMLVKDADSAINGKPIYARILIRRIN